MARTFTLGTLVTRCKQRCDMENQGLIADSERKGLISTVYGEFYSLIVDSGARYFEAQGTVARARGAAVDALPADHLATIGVDHLASAGGRRRALREFMAQERNVYSGCAAAEATAYALVGSFLRLSPTPGSPQTY